MANITATNKKGTVLTLNERITKKKDGSEVKSYYFSKNAVSPVSSLPEGYEIVGQDGSLPFLRKKG